MQNEFGAIAGSGRETELWLAMESSEEGQEASFVAVEGAVVVAVVEAKAITPEKLSDQLTPQEQFLEVVFVALQEKERQRNEKEQREEIKKKKEHG